MKLTNKNYTVESIPRIMESNFPGNICPSCKTSTLYPACVESKYDELEDKSLLLSFTVFCSECTHSFENWDNTNRKYFFSDKK